MDNQRSDDKPRVRASKERAEDVLEELHQLAGDVASVFDSHKLEENRALQSFDEVMDALENKVN